MHKELLVLGLLQGGPRTGYEVHQIVLEHGELYTDLKKGNVYYLLERLASVGLLQVQREQGAPGPLRERHIYTLTDQGRKRFSEILRNVVRTFDLMHTGVEVGMVFLPYLPRDDALRLLEERRQAIIARRGLVGYEAQAAEPLHEQLAREHLVIILEAELAWTEQALLRLRNDSATDTTTALSCPGSYTSHQGP